MVAVQSPEPVLFTPAEAAVLTQLSVKAVNNAIDKKTVAAVTGDRAGQATRLLDVTALMALTLERRLASRFPPALRRAVFGALPTARGTVVLDDGFLKIDLRQPRRELATSLRQLRRVRRLVVSDPGIYGGDPVFRGTRVPVHVVAEQLAQGAGETEILAGYPRLSAEMIQLAPLYAAAYPRRGRPPVQPWHGQAPRSTTRRKLDIAVT